MTKLPIIIKIVLDEKRKKILEDHKYRIKHYTTQDRSFEEIIYFWIEKNIPAQLYYERNKNKELEAKNTELEREIKQLKIKYE